MATFRHFALIVVLLLGTTSTIVRSAAAVDIPTQQAEQAAMNAMNTFSGVLSSTAEVFLSKRSAARTGAPSCTNQGTNACASSTPIGAPATIPPANLSLDLTTGAPIPRDANFVQVKRFDGELPSDWQLTVCPAVNLGLTWAANYEGKDNNYSTKPGSVLHQYFAGSDEAFAMYPARRWSSESCSKTSKSHLSLGYRPTERPYYTSGASGPKDVVILIDVSNYMPGSTSRLSVAKEAAKRLLATLSFSDFVAVVPFHRVVDGNVSTTMQRATLDVISDLQAKVDSIELSNYTRLFGGEKIPSSLGAAIRAAGNLLNTGSLFTSSSPVNLGTSGCSKTIILLSSGINTISVPTPVSEFFTANVSNAVIFGFAIVPTAKDLSEAEKLIKKTQDEIADSGNASTVDAATKVSAQANQIAALACAGSGVYRIAFTSNGNEDIATPLVDAFTAYFSALVQNTKGGARWSEIYDDVFGQGKVASASLPMYEAYRLDSSNGVKSYVAEPNVSTADRAQIEEWNGLPKELVGMVVMDVPLGNLSGTSRLLNETQVETLILKDDTCVPVNFQSSQSATKVQELSNGEKCVNVPGQELDVIKMRPLYICISVFTPLLMVLIPCLCAKKSIHSRESNDQKNCCGLIAFLLCWIICLSVFWTLVFDQIVRRDFWVKMEYTVRSHTPNEFRCCNIVDCSCNNYYGRSCSSMVNSLEEGSCNNGYHCCRQESYSCNCRTRRSCSGSGKHKSCSSHYHCDTCYRCVSSVSNWKCRSNCGKCYSPVVAVSYVYQGRVIVSHLVQTCTNVAESQQCLDYFFASNPIGSVRTGYVNPANPQEIATSDEWTNVGALVGFIIVAVLSIPPLILVWVNGCPFVWETVKCGGMSSSGGSSRYGTANSNSLLEEDVNNNNTSPLNSGGGGGGMTAAQKLEAQMMAEQEAEFSKPEPPVPTNFPPPPPPPGPLPTNVNPNPTTDPPPGYNTQWGADANNPWAPNSSTGSGGGINNSNSTAAPHYDVPAPAPPPAPKSEHTLGLPAESTAPGDGRLPPPPSYGADAL